MSSNIFHLIKLFVQNIKYTLGLDSITTFKGISVQIISFPSNLSTSVTILQVLFSPDNDDLILSTDALKAPCM